MPGKRVTIEDLARMVKKGFDETATKVQVDGLDRRLTNVESRLSKVEEKLDNIERIILKQQGDQIKNLERRMNCLEEMFAVK